MYKSGAQCNGPIVLVTAIQIEENVVLFFLSVSTRLALCFVAFCIKELAMMEE